MFVLGHVGIGTRVLGGLRQRLPARWLILGCLLPDLIDKPLFYLLLWAREHPDALIAILQKLHRDLVVIKAGQCAL